MPQGRFRVEPRQLGDFGSRQAVGELDEDAVATIGAHRFVKLAEDANGSARAMLVRFGNHTVIVVVVGAGVAVHVALPFASSPPSPSGCGAFRRYVLQDQIRFV